MKKIFIGCGVLALIILGILGFLAYQIAPVVMEAWDAAQGMGVELVLLEEEFPFDGSAVESLDQTRFASALDFRRELAAELDLLGLDLRELDQAIQEEDPSIFDWGDVLEGLWLKVGPVLDKVPGMLRRKEMSASELGWHSRVMWATLRRIDAGATDETMEPLHGQFDEFRRTYTELKRRQDDELPPLDDVIGDFDEAILDGAQAVFTEDPQRVLDGIKDPALEITYLSTLTEAMDGNSGIQVRVNGEDVLGGDSGDDPPPVDG
jgi:hypothetical protein